MKLSFFFAFAVTLFLKGTSGKFLRDESASSVVEEDAAAAALSDGFWEDVVEGGDHQRELQSNQCRSFCRDYNTNRLCRSRTDCGGCQRYRNRCGGCSDRCTGRNSCVNFELCGGCAMCRSNPTRMPTRMPTRSPTPAPDNRCANYCTVLTDIQLCNSKNDCGGCKFFSARCITCPKPSSGTLLPTVNQPVSCNHRDDRSVICEYNNMATARAAGFGGFFCVRKSGCINGGSWCQDNNNPTNPFRCIDPNNSDMICEYRNICRALGSGFMHEDCITFRRT